MQQYLSTTPKLEAHTRVRVYVNRIPLCEVAVFHSCLQMLCTLDVSGGSSFMKRYLRTPKKRRDSLDNSAQFVLAGRVFRGCCTWLPVLYITVA